MHHVAAEIPPAVIDGFALRVPRGFAARMRSGDERDPLLLQVLPTPQEAEQVDGFVPDPVGDLAALRGNGVLQKYANRALVVTTGACAVNCRYCFRRTFPYQDAALNNGGLAVLQEKLRQNAGVTEVILSGGDPLTLPDVKLARLLRAVAKISHVMRIRIHTRVPIVLPERVNDRLIELLSDVCKPLIIVLHANHANEIDASVRRAAERLRSVCRELLNQSVLLAGINDEADLLVDLSETMFRAGIMPYYIHQLDAVAGSAHFAVSDTRARRLLGEVAARLPGYLVPRLTRETIGASAKTILAPLEPGSSELST